MFLLHNEKGEVIGQIVSITMAIEHSIPIYTVGRSDGTSEKYLDCFGDITLKNKITEDQYNQIKNT